MIWRMLCFMASSAGYRRVWGLLCWFVSCGFGSLARIFDLGRRHAVHSWSWTQLCSWCCDIWHKLHIPGGVWQLLQICFLWAVHTSGPILRSRMEACLRLFLYSSQNFLSASRTSTHLYGCLLTGLSTMCPGWGVPVRKVLLSQYFVWFEFFSGILLLAFVNCAFAKHFRRPSVINFHATIARASIIGVSTRGRYFYVVVRPRKNSVFPVTRSTLDFGPYPKLFEGI